MQGVVITVLSDFGTTGVQAAALRALLMQAIPGSTIIDVNHSITPYDLPHAAYLLRGAWQHFPAGSIHIIAVDIFSLHAAMVVYKHSGHLFIAPDNGVLPLAFPAMADAKLGFETPRQATYPEWAGLTAALVADVARRGAEHLTGWQLKHRPVAALPVVTPLGIDCSIQHVDRFGNVVLGITREQFMELVKDKPFIIRLPQRQEVSVISHHYGEVKEGAPLCRFNRAGYLEVAVNRRSAATLLGLESYTSAALKYRTIKIFI